VVCAVAFVIFEFLGARCFPDKIWGHCNTAADVQLLVLAVGALATVATVLIGISYSVLAFVRSRGAPPAAAQGPAADPRRPDS